MNTVEKVGPTVSLVRNCLICGMCIHRKDNLLKSGSHPIWEVICKHPKADQYAHGWVGSTDDTPDWCPELKRNKEVKNRIECKKCRTAMRLWALGWQNGTYPNGHKMPNDMKLLCLTTAKHFRDGPCFHNEETK